MKKTTWINDKGNFCFFWEKDSYKGVLSFFSAILIVLIVSGIIDYFWVKGICSIVLIGVFIAMFIAYNYVNHKSNKKDAILLSIIKDKLDEQITFYISKRKHNIQEVKRKIFYQDEGTYGRIIGTFVICVFSDKSVIEYELIRHLTGNKEYYELTNEAQICKEKERLKAVIPFYTIKNILNNLSFSTETKLRVLIIGTLIISTLFAALFFLIFTHFDIMIICLCLFSYIIIRCFWNKYSGKITNLQLINWIIYAPGLLLGVALKLGQPAFIIYSALFLPIIIISSTVWIFITLLHFILGANIAYHTQLFIMLTTLEIICVHVPCITQWLIKNSLLKNRKNHKYEKYQEQLGLYVISPKNYNFLFSLLYVMFLSVNAFCQLEGHSYLFSADFDNAILKSFLVFLTFSTMKQKSKEMEINSKELLVNIKGLFLHDNDIGE